MFSFRIFGRLPYTWPVLLITLVSGMTQGIGIVLFLPVLHIMSGPPGVTVWPFTLLRDAFDAIGIPFTLPALLITITVFILASLALNFGRYYLIYFAMFQFMRRTRSEVIDSLLNASWPHLSRQASGITLNSLIDQTFNSARGLRHQLFAVSDAIQAAILVALSTMLSWNLLLLVGVFGVGAALAARPLRRRGVPLGQQSVRAEQDYSFQVVDYLRSIKLIKATSAEKHVGMLLERLQKAVVHAFMAKQVNLAGIDFVTRSIPVIFLACVIFVGHEILGLKIASILVFGLLFTRIVPLASSAQQLYQAFLQQVPAIRTVDNAVADHRARAEVTAAGAKPFSILTDCIRFEGVCYQFPKAEQPTINDLDLTINRHDVVGLVGTSGSGKSTLVEMLCGLRQSTRGRIVVDGDDLRDLDLYSWRRSIGYVTQDTIILNATVRENLVFAHPEATDENIRAAIDAAHLREVVDGLPLGLDTMLGEGGVRLSGGQKQRLALARALVGNPQILLLDEATSALDTESERIVQEAVDGLANKVTTIVVAHRLSTLRKADVIYVMESGRIVETGGYYRLLNTGGHFADLHALQFS